MIALKPKKGKLLIAEPAMTGDVSFNRSVVLLAVHNDEGSVGFILNKPLGHQVNVLVTEIEIPFQVYNGGPVEQDNLYFIQKVPHLINNSRGDYYTCQVNESFRAFCRGKDPAQ